MIVFTRAPISGRVKTRLAARIGPERAACLHERLTLAAVHTALSARCGAVEVHGTSAHAWLRATCRRTGARLRLQSGADLGERMANATRTALRRASFVLLMGADCPELSSRALREAARRLAGHADAVLAPARDGGYALIGLARPADFLFRDMPWGSEQVYAQTAASLKARGWRMHALAPVSDVDRAEDLERVRWLRVFSAARRRVAAS